MNLHSGPDNDALTDRCWSAVRWCAVILFVACIASAPQAQQQPPASRDDDMPDMWFEGTIGDNLRVRMYVGAAGWSAGGREPLWGAYFYTTQWKLIPLEGASLASGTVRLLEGDPYPPVNVPPPRAVFELNIMQSTAASGTWTSADGVRRLPVRLRRIAEPPRYAAALKKRARTFADPRWPFTFTYPAEWSLHVTDTTLLLQSADPQDMLFNNTLYCERGGNLPPPPRSGGVPVPFEGGFYRAHDGWVVADPGTLEMCDEPDNKCAKPHSRSSNGGVIMDTEIGYRSHNPWGYAGLASARSYLVIAGSASAQCIDRILDSPTRFELRPRASQH